MMRRSLVVGRDDLTGALGGVLCRDLSLRENGEARSIRRGAVIDQTLIVDLSTRAGVEIDVVFPDHGEMSQSEASWLVGRAVAGPGVLVETPHQGQCILRSETVGLLRVDGARVIEINRGGAILLATALDGRVVAPDETVAVVKGSRLWVPGAAVEAAQHLGGGRPLLRTAPFAARKAAFLAGSRVRAVNFAAAVKNMRATLARFGTDLIETAQVADNRRAIANAYQHCLTLGAEIILVAGSIVLDPEDPFLEGLTAVGGEVVCQGAPIDPGTMFWVGYVGSTVLYGLASCELYGRLSILDLLVPYAVAKEPISTELLAQLGYGGLLEHTYSSRQGTALRG